MHETPPNRWVRHGVAGIARTMLATLAGLLVWSVLPVVLGWQPTVVLSGSMEPAIGTGDVVVTRRLPADTLRPGHVLLVEDPARPGSRLLHRYDHADENGGLVLRGDANEDTDSTPVAPQDVIGVGMLRVPWVGLPYVWTTHGQYVAVGLTALTLVCLLALSPIRERIGQGDVDAGHPDDQAPPSAPRAHRSDGRHAAVAGATVLLVVGAGFVVGAGTTPASATFTSTASVTATFTAADTFPVPLEPAATEAPPTERTVTTEPAAPEPATTEPTPSEPAAMEPAPAERTVTDPTSTAPPH